MAKQSEDSSAANGCATLLIVGVIYLLISAYVNNVNRENALLGGVVGALAGAGVGVVVFQSTKGYRRKAKLGPLPWFAYSGRVARLRAKYLGEKIAGRARSQLAVGRVPEGETRRQI